MNIASGSWKDYSLKAYRFSNLGTSNLSIMVGLKAAIDFHGTIGPDRIYRRIHQLASSVHDRVTRYLQFPILNASADAFYGGMVAFGAPEATIRKIFEEGSKRKIRVSGGANHVRVSTHIFTQPSEIDAFFEAVDAGVGRAA